MITLQRLIELRKDKALMRRLFSHVQTASSLLAYDSSEAIRGIMEQQAAAIEEAKSVSEAVSLVIYEETRLPYIEFLKELDHSAVVRTRPHLHAKLKELIK